LILAFDHLTQSDSGGLRFSLALPQFRGQPYLRLRCGH
jgi:hypothetical protein